MNDSLRLQDSAEGGNLQEDPRPFAAQTAGLLPAPDLSALLFVITQPFPRMFKKEKGKTERSLPIQQGVSTVHSAVQ